VELWVSLSIYDGRWSSEDGTLPDTQRYAFRNCDTTEKGLWDEKKSNIISMFKGI
jgi:hypothetical protein